MSASSSTEKKAINALRDGRYEMAVEIWKDHQEEVGNCELNLCDSTNHFLSCCASHFQGRLLTLSMIERNKDFHELAKSLGSWIKENKPALKDADKIEAQVFSLPDSLIIGHPTIDHDHRVLVGTLNDISRSLNNDDFKETARLIEEFASQIEQHFEIEIEILKQVDFPGIDGHAAIHEDLSKKLRDMGKQAFSTADNEVFKETTFPELVSLLLDDAIKADMEFKTFLIDSGQALD